MLGITFASVVWFLVGGCVGAVVPSATAWFKKQFASAEYHANDIISTAKADVSGFENTVKSDVATIKADVAKAANVVNKL